MKMPFKKQIWPKRVLFNENETFFASSISLLTKNSDLIFANGLLSALLFKSKRFILLRVIFFCYFQIEEANLFMCACQHWNTCFSNHFTDWKEFKKFEEYYCSFLRYSRHGQSAALQLIFEALGPFSGMRKSNLDQKNFLLAVIVH